MPFGGKKIRKEQALMPTHLYLSSVGISVSRILRNQSLRPQVNVQLCTKAQPRTTKNSIGYKLYEINFQLDKQATSRPHLVNHKAVTRSVCWVTANL